jgi:hypothetical protein
MPTSPTAGKEKMFYAIGIIAHSSASLHTFYNESLPEPADKCKFFLPPEPQVSFSRRRQGDVIHNTQSEIVNLRPLPSALTIYHFKRGLYRINRYRPRNNTNPQLLFKLRSIRPSLTMLRDKPLIRLDIYQNGLSNGLVTPPSHAISAGDNAWS